MMDINLHTVLTLEDGENYIVVARINLDGYDYDYLMQVSADETEIENKVVIVKEEKENDFIYINEIKDEKKLEVLLPLFENQLEKEQ